MHIRQKYWLKYTDCAELRKITITNCLIIFFKSFKFHCCSFCLIKKVKVNCTSVLPILFVYFLVDFFKEKI